KLETPSVIGQHIHDAIKLLSTHHLNARILSEKEDLDLPEGIVISQSPVQGQKIKSQQSIFLVVTRRPPKAQAPRLFGLNNEESNANTQKKGIQLKSYSIESICPQE